MSYSYVEKQNWLAKITITSVRECTVPSEPSVMVAEGCCSDQGIFWWGGCYRIWVSAPAIWRICSRDGIIAIGLPDEGSCRIVVGGSIVDKDEVELVVYCHKYQYLFPFMSLERLNCLGCFAPLHTCRKKLNTCSKQTAASLISERQFCLLCSLFMHRRCDPTQLIGIV